ncbi:ferritin-like domain-containing protein [Deinococcus psychrotolerans]|uniref:Ferritin-like domain-containing protein n=1 Tax=Deinococcus psychrotolerans TaxID=2489213 RepID=A0A3G8YKK5_9DEIO|nr:ferritin-like domain-containing protein [Deinococcus psychrotolerans]AZI41596.1 ferritin-like domain-containing protein [Deinococcus psychrotolerans]
MSDINRREALGTLGKLGLGAAALGLGGSALAVPAKNIDGDVLNFALNLEYLEAAFYAAAVGRLAEVRAIGGSAPIALPANLPASGMQFKDSNIQAYVNSIADDEIAHVKFLYGALGKGAVARPLLDLSSAFDAAGQAASGGAIKGFNPYANELFFLHGAFIFEDVGVTAYNGAATLLTNPAYLQAAAGILAAEAYHAGSIRTFLLQKKDVVAAAGLTVEQIVNAISALRAKVGGGKDKGLTENGKPVLMPDDANGGAFARTTREVLNIVYLAPNANKGGFFPQGLNGAIK